MYLNKKLGEIYIKKDLKKEDDTVIQNEKSENIKDIEEIFKKKHEIEYEVWRETARVRIREALDKKKKDYER